MNSPAFEYERDMGGGWKKERRLMLERCLQIGHFDIFSEAPR
jgi:hypothetical protein